MTQRWGIPYAHVVEHATRRGVFGVACPICGEWFEEPQLDGDEGVKDATQLYATHYQLRHEGETR